MCRCVGVCVRGGVRVCVCVWSDNNMKTNSIVFYIFATRCHVFLNLTTDCSFH